MVKAFAKICQHCDKQLGFSTLSAGDFAPLLHLKIFMAVARRKQTTLLPHF